MATTQQIPQLAGILVQHQDYLGNLSNEDCTELARNPHFFLVLAMNAWIERKKTPQPPHRAVASFDAQWDGPFSGKNFLSKEPKSPRIVMDDAFLELYVPKEEQVAKRKKLRSYRPFRGDLLTYSNTMKVTSLADLYQLISLREDNRMLAFTGHVNLFRIPDKDNKEGLVRAFRSSGLFNLCASPIEETQRKDLEENLLGGRLISS